MFKNRIKILILKNFLNKIYKNKNQHWIINQMKKINKEKFKILQLKEHILKIKEILKLKASENTIIIL